MVFYMPRHEGVGMKHTKQLLLWVSWVALLAACPSVSHAAYVVEKGEKNAVPQQKNNYTLPELARTSSESSTSLLPAELPNPSSILSPLSNVTEGHGISKDTATTKPSGDAKDPVAVTIYPESQYGLGPVSSPRATENSDDGIALPAPTLTRGAMGSDGLKFSSIISSLIPVSASQSSAKKTTPSLEEASTTAPTADDNTSSKSSYGRRGKRLAAFTKSYDLASSFSKIEPSAGNTIPDPGTPTGAAPAVSATDEIGKPLADADLLTLPKKTPPSASTAANKDLQLPSIHTIMGTAQTASVSPVDVTASTSTPIAVAPVTQSITASAAGSTQKPTAGQNTNSVAAKLPLATPATPVAAAPTPTSSAPTAFPSLTAPTTTLPKNTATVQTTAVNTLAAPVTPPSSAIAPANTTATSTSVKPPAAVAPVAPPKPAVPSAVAAPVSNTQATKTIVPVTTTTTTTTTAASAPPPPPTSATLPATSTTTSKPMQEASALAIQKHLAASETTAASAAKENATATPEVSKNSVRKTKKVKKKTHSAPPPEEADTTLWPDSIDGGNASLSSESRQTLARLPKNIDKKSHTASSPFSVDHTDARINEIFPDSGYSTDTPVGISIEVKKPDININYELEKAYNAILNGQNSEAVSIYKSVIAADKNNKLALFGLATTYHRAGDLKQARTLYGRLLTIDPNHREALNNFLALVAEESPQEALAQLKKLQHNSPDFSPIPAQIAMIYQKTTEYPLAIDYMKQALQLSPENLTYLYNLAILYDKNNQGPEAASLYRRLLEAASAGETIPGNVEQIQERLTFLESNHP